MSTKILARLTAAVIAAVILAVMTACGSSHSGQAGGNASSAAARASSAMANPTASADMRQAEKIFSPCFTQQAMAQPHPVTTARSCAEGKIPAVQDAHARHAIEISLGKCLAAAYQKLGSVAALRQSGWQPCAQAAYTAALAANASPSATAGSPA